MVKKRKSKKVTRSKKRSSTKKSSKENRMLIYGLAGVIALAFIVMAFPNGNQKKDVRKVSPAKEVKENKVSDIKQTKEVKLNIPKKTKAINTPSFNEKAIQIRFAEIDYNSNKKISLKEYLYYFKDKSVGKKKFKSIDKNKDKSITYDEYLASRR
tara:strand:+ start:141 stop:605 length:465 start_codon:yes stop_codon:yes gene_type:complete